MIEKWYTESAEVANACFEALVARYISVLVTLFVHVCVGICETEDRFAT